MALIQKNINWKPYEVIYSAGDEPDGLYLIKEGIVELYTPEGLKFCLLYTSPSPRDRSVSRMPSSA